MKKAIFISLFLLLGYTHQVFAQAVIIPDPTFLSGVGFASSGGSGFNPVDMLMQSDGKIIVGLSGTGLSYNGTPIPNFVRLNPDGTLDTTFLSGTGFTPNGIRHVYLTPEGKITVGGTFTSYNGTPANRIIRLNSDGSVDTSFNYGTGFNTTVYPVTVQSDGKIIVSGFITNYNGTPVPRIVRLNNDGTIDTTFNTGTGLNAFAWFIAQQIDGKLILSGDFTSYNGTPANRIIRLNSDGSVDTTFNYGTGLGTARAYYLSILPGGKILLVGDFTSYNGTPTNRIIRLNSDGSVDTTFNYGTGFNNSVQAVTVQRNSKILITGDFTSYNGTPANRIIRLNSDGSVDATFNTGTGFNNNTYTNILVQSDNKIIIGGTYTSFDGTSAGHIIRLTVPDVITPAITNLSMVSNNLNPEYATTGDTVTVTFTSDDGLTGASINLGGQFVNSTCIGTGIVTCTAQLPVTALIPLLDGPLSVNVIPITAGSARTAITSIPPGVTIERLNPIPLPAWLIRQQGSSVSGIMYCTDTIKTFCAIKKPPTDVPVVFDIPTTFNTPAMYVSPIDGSQKLCKPFNAYLKAGSKSNSVYEVKLWQAFLNTHMSEKLPITGVYGNATIAAIKKFQQKYTREILSPWGLKKPTGYTYQSTRAKANALLGCSEGKITLDNGVVIK